MAERRSSSEPRAVVSLAVLLAAGVVASVGCVSIDDRPTVQAGESGQGTSSGGTSAKGGSGGTSAKGGSGGTTGGTTGGTGAKGGGGGTTGGATSGGSGGTSASGGTGGSRGGTGGTGGSGGTTGGATSGGSGGTSASGGTGGSRGGTGGSGGTGGTSGSSGTTCGDDVTPTAARVRTCVYALSCNPLVPFATMSGCLTYGLYYDCNEGATSCADVEACTGVAREPAASCSGATGWNCSGDVAIRCDVAEPYSVDCGHLGGTCDLFESTEVEAYRFPCKLPSPSTCSPDDPTYFECSDKYTVACVDGKPYGTDCTAWGATCVEATPGEATCSRTSADCTEYGTATCVDNAIHYCDTDGRLGVYDCSPAGATCAEGGYCLSAGCDTTEADACMESCIDATHAQACVGGAPYVIDCTDYGFTGCITYTDSDSMTPYVECTMDAATAGI